MFHLQLHMFITNRKLHICWSQTKNFICWSQTKNYQQQTTISFLKLNVQCIKDIEWVAMLIVSMTQCVSSGISVISAIDTCLTKHKYTNTKIQNCTNTQILVVSMTQCVRGEYRGWLGAIDTCPRKQKHTTQQWIHVVFRSFLASLVALHFTSLSLSLGWSD